MTGDLAMSTQTRGCASEDLVATANLPRYVMWPPSQPYYYAERLRPFGVNVARVDLGAVGEAAPDTPAFSAPQPKWPALDANAGFEEKQSAQEAYWKAKAEWDRLHDAHWREHGGKAISAVEARWRANYGPLPRLLPEGDAYAWGDAREGARHLALALLADACGPGATDLAGRFVSEVLAKIRSDRWTLSRGQVRGWVELQGAA